MWSETAAFLHRSAVLSHCEGSRSSARIIYLFADRFVSAYYRDYKTVTTVQTIRVSFTIGMLPRKRNLCRCSFVVQAAMDLALK